MVTEWRTVKLGDAFNINPRRVIKRGDMTPYIPMDALPVHARDVMRVEEREFTGSGARFKNGDTLLARITPCLENGKTVYISCLPDSIVAHGSTEFIVIAEKAGVTSGLFGYYIACSPEFRSHAVSHMVGTSGRQRVPNDAVEGFQVSLPPLPDQRAIAHILGTLDDKIELNRRMNQTLEAMAKAIFQSWFVDFEPVRAKMAGRWHEGESLPGLPAHLYDFFPDRLVDSELGEIPEGWTPTPVSEVANHVKGTSYRSGDLKDSRTALVTLKSFSRGGGYRSDGLKSYSGSYKTEQVVRPGELIVACTDVTQAAEVIGRPAIVQSTYEYAMLVASLDVLVVRPKDARFPGSFLYCLFSGERFTEHTYANSTGTTVLHLSKEAVPSYRFVLPSVEIVRAFGASAQPAMERMGILHRECQSLEALRDTLLPKLISGELRIKDAEKIVGEIT